jgi:hypothetical protein
MIDPVFYYIMKANSSYIPLYMFTAMRKRNINTVKVAAKYREVYGQFYHVDKFIEFGEKYLNQYLIDKHKITFADLVNESYEGIRHRFAHLARLDT